MNNLRRAWARLGVVPFETAIALLALLSGVLGLFHYGGIQDTLGALLPPWMLTANQLIYFISGALILYGTARARPAPESLGLVLLAASVLIRGCGLLIVAGDQLPVVIVALVFDLFLIGACVVRLSALLQGRTLVQS